MLALPRVALFSSALKRFSTACSGNISKPLCRFGMIADVQYADIDDDKNFSGMELRSYRGSLAVVERASKAWQLQPHSFILQLGDIIDGQNSGKYGQGLTKFSPCGSQSDVALRRVLDLFSKYGWSGDKIYSAVGNHEFYCWPDRSVLASKIPQLTASSSADSSDQLFQSFSPAPGWRVIVLDAYDVAIIGRPPGSSEFNQAIDLLRSKNPNISEDGSATANFLTNLVGLSRRFVPYNGAIGRVQMDWLQATLDKCRSEGEAAIICCHVPILPESAIPSCLLWNFQDILHLIHKHNSFCSAAHGRVVSIFSGHFHGGRTVSDSGILYVSLKSPLLSPHAYYSVELYENRLRILSPLGHPYACDEFVFA